MKKRILGLLLCMVMMITLFAACTSEPATADEAPTADATTEETPADSGEKVTLTLSNLFPEGETWNQPFVQAVENFNANENAEIILEMMPQEAYLTQTNARGTADDLAEIVLVNGTMMKAFSDTGVIIPLDDMYTGLGIDGVMRPGLIADGTNIDDGGIYSFPIALGTYGFILYNTEIFTEAGVEEFPTTLTEFAAACDSIIAAGYTPMGLGIRDVWAGDSILFSAFVNNYVGNEWYESIRKSDGQATFNDQQFIDALAAYQSLATAGYFNEDFVSISNDERMALYLNKEAAMISAGDWESKSIVGADAALAEVTSAAFWPAAEGSEVTNSIVQSGAWGIALGSRITDDQKMYAEIFLRDYFFTDATAQLVFEAGNELTSWEYDYDESLLSVPAAAMYELVAAGTACQNWDASLDPTVKEVYQRGLQDLLMGAVTPEELAASMQAEYELANQ